ncbi:hypothetical protein J6590_090483 [Homalodisca vitripennis]|nr:hypothetical protein J6590_090483 [Homalodisca vitripennis]
MDTADSFVSSVLFSPVCPHSTPVQYIADSSSAQCCSAPVCSHSSPVQYITDSFVSSVLLTLSVLTAPLSTPLSSTMDTADSFVSSVLFSPCLSSQLPCSVHSGFIRQLSVVQPLSVLTAPLSTPVCPHSSPVQYIADSFVSSVLFSPCLSSQLPCPVHSGFIRQLSVVQPLSVLTAPLSTPLSSTMDTADSFVSSVLFSSVCPHSSPIQYIADSFVSSVLFSSCLFSQLPCPVHNGFIRQLSVVQPLSVLTAPLSST